MQHYYKPFFLTKSCSSIAENHVPSKYFTILTSSDLVPKWCSLEGLEPEENISLLNLQIYTFNWRQILLVKGNRIKEMQRENG